MGTGNFGGDAPGGSSIGLVIADSAGREVVELLQKLPPRQQPRVLSRVLSELEYALPAAEAQKRESLRELWRGLDVTEEDIAQARREMWGHFPREDV